MASLQIFVMVAVIACGVAIPILEIPHFPHLEHKEIVLHEPIHHVSITVFYF
ncbi:hypothetical protein C0J52_01181 [Blattella germanica]|nr:hypothetical protein C0J52_01181 [Blattella germanica]